MAMNNMALTKAEAESEYGDCCPTTEAEEGGPRYPWGLQISLEQSTLDKLGLGLIPVGSEVLIMAKAVVTGTSSRERVKGPKKEDMDIQITHLDLAMSMTTPDERQAKSASKLYPEK